MNNRINSKGLLISSIAAVLVFGMTSFAYAGTSNTLDSIATPMDAVPTDGSSVFLVFDGPFQSPGPSSDLQAPYTFDCGGASCWVQVDDCCIITDQYEVFDFGQSINDRRICESITDPHSG